MGMERWPVTQVGFRIRPDDLRQDKRRRAGLGIGRRGCGAASEDAAAEISKGAHIKHRTADSDPCQLGLFSAFRQMIGAVGVRALLRTLNMEPGERRLAELGPPQKTRQLDRRGRTLAITTTLLVQGSCGISRPCGDDRTLQG